MQHWREFRGLLLKEFLLDLRRGYALAGLVAYVFMLSFAAAVAMREAVSPLSWVVTYWLIMLFITINAVAKSFLGEPATQLNYLYQLASAPAVILAKLLYNSLLMILLGLLCFGLYLLLLGNPFPDVWLMLPVVGAGALGLAAGTTLLSGLVSRANNRATLMAVLSLPVLLPQALLLIRLSHKASLNVLSSPDLGMEALILIVLVALSLLLFPYFWRA